MVAVQENDSSDVLTHSPMFVCAVLHVVYVIIVELICNKCKVLNQTSTSMDVKATIICW